MVKLRNKGGASINAVSPGMSNLAFGVVTQKYLPFFSIFKPLG